ncbi:XrtA system polysaccharide deacetylase [Flocculibacter collagenilyticus]|uniref:XrtA system polysaccharide deacetylase n=1 Tax=Flocculibacter collagenilyticus TaxID=2744479 RepID=UPI001F1A6006|nr:XrtA system polysaccharide deacetylase [Flocculibacter collagenilyticus]
MQSINNKNKPLCALTIDVEDYFHVSAFEKAISRKDWKTLEPRVQISTEQVLQQYARHNVKGTFFILGWVADAFPELIKKIHAEGHEIACHGYWHQRATDQTRLQFLDDVSRSKNLLEDLIGEPIRGYRAPSFSISPENEWAFEVLAELGFVYSSSTYPVQHDHYGTPDWPDAPYMRPEGILEIPIPTLNVRGKNLPIGGGGYFRLAPYWLSKYFITRYLDEKSIPYSFYYHPWEVDPKQPRINAGSLKSKFRHYVNLSRMEGKMDKLLNDFNWSTIYQTYQDDIEKGIRSGISNKTA